MIEEVMQNIFRVPVPLVDNPLQFTNAYIIKGRDRDLVIDTGMDREECKNALLAAFAALEMDLEQTDFFITHIHIDHLELVFRIASDRSSVFFNRHDAAILYDDSSWDKSIDLAKAKGFPGTEIKEMINSISNSVFSLKDNVAFTYVQEGDKLVIGDYELTCLETPGHSPGSTCLYEVGKKFLFSGDHVLADITPNISIVRDGEYNSMKNYLESLEKVLALDLELILPGHRGLIREPQQRIRELQHHHRQREAEILRILNKGPADAYTVASQMTWDIPRASWQDFPLFQQWFAAGEALAHLKYLEGKGQVRAMQSGDKIIYACDG